MDEAKRILKAASLPARGVWIEIIRSVTRRPRRRSLPVRGVWIEILSSRTLQVLVPSLPARGVWIEIFGPFGQAKRARVALLTESVD